mgnify:CR=1 FL=1
MANEAQFYEGTTINHITSGASLADAGFSLDTDISVNVDNTFYKFPLGKAILIVNDVSAAPAAGKTVDLYRRGMNVSSTLDEPQPDSNFKATFVGSFLIDAVDPAASDTPYVLMGVPLLPNEMQFYIQNNLGVTLSSWKLSIIPYTYKPAA